MNGIIFYTDNRVWEPARNIIRRHISAAGLPIVSVSLRPIEFGKNILVRETRGYVTMIKQILIALQNSTAENVFFCEHDVLYHKSHFEFTPKRPDIFYYNENVWRWPWGELFAFRYDRMISLSGMCANREFALKHYQLRMKKIEEYGVENFTGREPQMARRWGYEPGTKKIKRGGVTDDNFETWSSRYPLIDIRHKGTFSSPKTKLKHFKHPPENWQEIAISQIPDWDLKTLFNL